MAKRCTAVPVVLLAGRGDGRIRPCDRARGAAELHETPWWPRGHGAKEPQEDFPNVFPWKDAFLVPSEISWRSHGKVHCGDAGKIAGSPRKPLYCAGWTKNAEAARPQQGLG